MKTLVLIPIIFFCILEAAHTQTDTFLINKSYRIWLSPMPKQKIRNKQGLLFDVKDSSLIISDSRNKEDYYGSNFNVAEVNAKMIKKVFIRKTGAQGIGTAIGGVTGLLLGLSLGILQYTGGGTEGDRALQTGGIIIIPLLFTGLGVGIGATIGGMKIKIPIKGSQIKFDHYKDRLIAHSLKHNSEGKFPSSPVFSKLRDTVVDIDGNVYHTVALGWQVWMSENLRVKKYRNGDPIQNITDSAEWRRLTSGAYCNYRNDTGNATVNGRLYNWFAVNDSRKLCPAGWHVPSETEFVSLINRLGGEGMIEKALESKETAHSSGNNNKATLIRTFFAFSGELRNHEGKFSPRGHSGLWWSATMHDSLTSQGLYQNDEDREMTLTSCYKSKGFSIRCLRDH